MEVYISQVMVTESDAGDSLGFLDPYGNREKHVIHGKKKTHPLENPLWVIHCDSCDSLEKKNMGPEFLSNRSLMCNVQAACPTDLGPASATGTLTLGDHSELGED